MISVKMYQEKWRLEIVNEELEFNSLSELKEKLGTLLDLKDKHGRLHKKRCENVW